MATKKKIFAFAITLLAAVFAFAPVHAFADDVTVITSDSDMIDSNGRLIISNVGNYKLADDLNDLTGIVFTNRSSTVSLDLNGHTITSPAGSAYPCLTIMGYNGANTVSNGTLVQQEASQYGVAVGAGTGTTNLILNDVNVTTTNNTCVKSLHGTVQINGGTYKVVNTDGSDQPVLQALVVQSSGLYGFITVNGGTFTNEGGSSVLYVDTKDGKYPTKICGFTINGGTYSAAPIASLVGYGSDTAILGNSDGTYTVDSAENAENVAQYLVEISGVPNDRVYFVDRAAANAFAKANDTEAHPTTVLVTLHGNGGTFDGKEEQLIRIDYGAKLSDKTIENPVYEGRTFQYWEINGTAKYDLSTPVTKDINLYAEWKKNPTVTFNTDGGSPVPDAQTVAYNSTASEPSEDPKKEGYKFKYWSLDGTTEYDFFDKVIMNITLKAVWEKLEVVAKIGSKGYYSLQDAVDAVQDGQTITLVGDPEECVVAKEHTFTIDLAGHTFSNSGDDDYDNNLLTVEGSANVTLKSQGGAGYLKGVDINDVITVQSSDAAITIEDNVNVNSDEDSCNALFVDSGTATINGGSFTADDDIAVFVQAGSLTINGGTIGNPSDKDSEALQISTGITSDATNVSITGGDFYGDLTVYKYPSAVGQFDMNVSGGTFDSGANIVADHLAGGKALLYNKQQRYEVLDAEAAKARANRVVRFTLDDTVYTVYFEDADIAQKFFDEMHSADTDSIKAVYHVTFESRGKTVKKLNLEEDEPFGKLPDAGTISGWSFVGWYIDGEYADANKVSAETLPTGDVTVKSLWLQDGSTTPTTGPEADSDSGSDSSNGSNSNSSAKALPKTGDAATIAAIVAATGSALAAAGIRRKK